MALRHFVLIFMIYSTQLVWADWESNYLIPQSFDRCDGCVLSTSSDGLPWFSVRKIDVVGTTFTRQASPEIVRTYQRMLMDIENRRLELERNWTEFVRAFIEELQKKSLSGEVRPLGNKQKISAYFSLIKQELRVQLPNNIFVNLYEKRLGGFKISAFVKSDLEKIPLSYFPNDEMHRPSTLMISELVGRWMELYFHEQLHTSSLRVVDHLRIRPVNSWQASELKHNIAGYKAFIKDFVSLDPEKTYGHRVEPGRMGTFKLSLSVPTHTGHEVRCGGLLH